MIEGNKYTSAVKTYFNFLITEFGFKIWNEKIRGNAFYEVQYNDGAQVVSVSYENIEDYLQVIIFLLHKGVLPDYDDKTKALHLSQLNARILRRIDAHEINSNNEHFMKFNAEDEVEKKLLKSAKELRLVLKHFKELPIE